MNVVKTQPNLKPYRHRPPSFNNTNNTTTHENNTMFLFLLQKLKSIFLLFFNIFRRAFCCFRRRRRASKDEPLSNIVVGEHSHKNELEQWNDWEFKNRKPASVEEHIEYYRQQQAKLRQQQQQPPDAADEPEVDLFNDMMPQIKPQAKIVIGKDKVEGNSGNALSLQATDAYITNELENWNENSGWETEALDANELLREKKREERERRALEQQQKRAEKSNRPILGAKLVT